MRASVIALGISTLAALGMMQRIGNELAIDWPFLLAGGLDHDVADDALTIAGSKHEDHPSLPIPNPLVIRLTGADHRWQAVYPIRDADIAVAVNLVAHRPLHVPVDTEIVLALSSRDYLYTLSLPDFDQKQIAVPRREFLMKFRPRRAGTYRLIGEELCGLAGSPDAGEIVVESPQQFQKWWREKRNGRQQAQ